MKSRVAALSVAAMMVSIALPLAAQQTVTRGANLFADVATDGRVAIDLAGDIWVVPPGGGTATALTTNLGSAARPRWSPNGSEIAYQALGNGAAGIFVYDVAARSSRSISHGASFDMRPAWHPSGERIVYASDATGTGFDLWEIDLQSGLHWRLSAHEGDETDAAWSSDGRDLVYVHRRGDQSALILRRHGRAEETLLTTTDHISGPAWRPDGSLITFVCEDEAGRRLDMVILSQPRLRRTLASGEAFGRGPVSWMDRHRMVYTAGGGIRQRLFNAWTSSPIPFAARLVADVAEESAKAIRRRPLERIDEPPGRLVVRAARLYDGVGGGYQIDRDVVIEGGRIAALEAHRARPGDVVIDMGDLTVLPGYVDARGDLASLIRKFGDSAGPVLLSSGVTTLVSDQSDSERLNRLWSGKLTPGPRLLPQRDWPLPRLRSLADATTPGLAELLQSRQTLLSRFTTSLARRYSEPLELTGSASDAVLSSFANGLPAGIGLHAELLALVAAQLTPEQALKAAGVNAAAALKLDPLIGRISVGATADLVFVDGDPLERVGDALKIVAVVRNGRFYSVSGLIDRVQLAETVE